VMREEPNSVTDVTSLRDLDRKCVIDLIDCSSERGVVTIGAGIVGLATAYQLLLKRNARQQCSLASRFR
jgi:hypothetical protein